VELIRIFVGFDQREAVAYHVCCQSIIESASQPVAFTPLALNNLSGYQERHRDGSNAFIYSRFLVPYLCDFNGWAIFLDGDMAVAEDVATLWALRDPWKAALVVKHDYRTKHAVKYLGAPNEDYPRKNWSSVILWNCGHYLNRKLTPEFVAQAGGAELHRFSWIPDERLGALPRAWNHLVLEYPDRPDAALYHYTIGTPCFPEYRDCEASERWVETFKRATEPM
jgi:lipopolysaccharide biosynthesis glycosyltransferase